MVSPNVKDDEKTVEKWRNASLLENAAFMGYKPNYYDHDQSGPKFAGTAKQGIQGVMPDDVILIARQHGREPDIVGFGIVHGEHAIRLKGFKHPGNKRFGSLRYLESFTPWSRPPSGIPLRDVLRHTKALVQLHPEKYGTHKKYDAHKEVCNWMENHLGNRDSKFGKKHRATTERKRKLSGPTLNIDLVNPPEAHQLDYIIQTKNKVFKAKKNEAILLKNYQDWLKKQGRKFIVAIYGALRCDGYERERGNLIEAKSSARREHIRMAVGQLLDYAFQGKEELGEPNKAILLPNKPHPKIAEWLLSLEIRIIWRERGSFLDNANGQFS